MFCGCDACHFQVEPNTHTCPVCLGLPGALPVPNKTACDWTIKLGLALNCSINQHTFFERKNYFYPDLPKGYQITQLQKPFSVNGFLIIDGHKVRINRAHLEEDTGKSIHQGQDTLLDFNRSGVPLVEIVSEPDIVSAAEAKKYLSKVQQIIRYLDISDADIEKGSMRCEPTVNVKIEIDGQAYFTPLVEIKNVASLTGVSAAIDYEVNRQITEFEEKRIVKSPGNKTTRGYDAARQATFLQRQKEGSADYRYFPEPDIPPIYYEESSINTIRESLPEMPDSKIKRYQTEYGLSDYDANLIAQDMVSATTFDGIVGFVAQQHPQQASKFAKHTANLFLGPVRTYLNEQKKNITDLNLTPRFFWELFTANEEGKISSSVSKQLIVESHLLQESPLEIAAKRGLIQISDNEKINKLAKQVIADNPRAISDYRQNPASIGFLIGQLMKLSGGAANPTLARQILQQLLKESSS